MATIDHLIDAEYHLRRAGQCILADFIRIEITRIAQ
jgi:hypothetical protein